MTKDTFEFVDELRALDVNNFMVSFDVDSLFTNVPIEETIEIILYELFPTADSKVNGICRNDFKELLELAVKDSIFVFNNCYYKQTDGVAMGSPLGPALANIFMSHLEKAFLRDCPQHFKPTYYKRYVVYVVC